jgi:hypothetical protein
MADPMNGPITRCPWCSAEISIPGAESCPSCGAALVSVSGTDQEIRGVTTLDPEAILRARTDAVRPRNRILSFITGETESEPVETADLDAIAPPADAVRREMLRMELEANLADLAAETVALKADALAERGVPLTELQAEAEAIEANIEQVDPGDDWPHELTPAGEAEQPGEATSDDGGASVGTAETPPA